MVLPHLSTTETYGKDRNTSPTTQIGYPDDTAPMDHARQWAWVLIQKYGFIFMLPASTNLHLHQDNEHLAGYCSVKIPNMLQWKHSAVVRSDVRWWHIAEPKSPIFHLYGGGKPWSRGLVPPGRDVQTLSGKAHSGNYHPSITNTHRERVY